jgi:energy-coupling factor transporter ATP-binding protein EcfA2
MNRDVETTQLVFPSDDLFVPDRFEQLAGGNVNLRTIVVPVKNELETLNTRFREMRASRRGAMVVLRGETGSGKSTFLDTVGLFVKGVESVRIPASASIASALAELSPTDRVRIIVLEGREALRDVEPAVLEDAVHAINAHVRGGAQSDLIVWPANTDDLAEKLAELAGALGGEALLGTGSPIQRFTGPPNSEYVHIAQQTISALNEGASLAALGVTTERAEELAAGAPTIGRYLALIRDELLANGGHVRGLLAEERFRMWTVVVAGDDAERDVAALTRGPYSVADVDRLLTATEANIVKELREHPAQLGILGTMLDAKIVSLGTLEILSIAREFGDQTLHDLMRANNMVVKRDARALERLASSELGLIMSGRSLGLRKTGAKPGTNTQVAFRSLADIARTNDIACNRAIGNALVAAGYITSFTTEKDLGTGLTRKSDLFCETSSDSLRIEVMWRAENRRADIAQYVLSKLRNYARAIGLLG